MSWRPQVVLRRNAMSTYLTTTCKTKLDELEHDRAQRLDQEQGLTDTTKDVVRDIVAELMAEDSQDEDSMVVLMESDRFIRALRKLLGNRYDDASCHESLVQDAVNAVSIAETVLSEYVELGL
jgi:hypothetical protein